MNENKELIERLKAELDVQHLRAAQATFPNSTLGPTGIVIRDAIAALDSAGRDGELLDWLEKNPFTMYRTRDHEDGKLPDYCVLVNEDRHKDGQGRTGILRPTARDCIDAAMSDRAARAGGG